MNRVIHFEFQADDVNRAKNFYEKALGWKIEKMMSADDTGGMDYWGVTTGESGPGINGGMYQRPPEGDKFYLYDCTVLVDDLDQAMAAVKINGGTIIKDKMEIPKVGWFAVANDTEGNRLGLMQATGWQPK